MAASTTTGSASTSSAADVSREPFEVKYWYLPDKDKQIWRFLNEFARKPHERSTDKEEQKLVLHIRKHISKLHVETQAKLNALDDPAGCVAFASSHLRQLARHTCSPPADLVRILKIIAQVPAQSVIEKERFESAEEEAKGHGSTRRQTQRWRNAGIVRMPRAPAYLNNGIEKRTRILLPMMQYCLMHAVHEEVCDCLSGDVHPVQAKRRLFIDFYSACRDREKRLLEPFPNSPKLQMGFRSIQTFSMLATLGPH